MTLARLGLFVFFLPSMVGFLLWESAQAPGKRHHWESLAFAFPIGWGVLSSLMLVLANIGFRIDWITPAILASCIAIAAMIYIVLSGKKQSAGMEATPETSPASSKRPWVWSIFFGVVILELGLMTASIVQFPYITDWDGWAIWGFKAKAFFIDHGFTGYLSQAQIYDFSWPARPCISSIFQAYAYLVGGQVNEAASRIVHLAGGISLLLIFYWTLRRRLSSSTAMIWTAMLATIPNLTSQATVGLGNILLAIFLFSAVSSLDRYRTEGRAGYLIAASAFLGFALLTRDEASGLCAICVAVALFFAPCPRFTSRGRMIVKTIMALAGAIILYSLWMRLIDPYHIKTLRSEWLKPGILQRAFQHLRDLEGVLALFLAQFAAPSKQTLASPLEKYLGVAFFWVIFAFVFVFSGIRSILNRRTIPIGQQNELATICGFCAALGLIAYSAGLWLFPYSSLNDLEYWCNVLNRHILSLVPLAACHIALSLSSDSSCLPKPMSARIESGNAL